jgi:hypothetical protein
MLNEMFVWLVLKKPAIFFHWKLEEIAPKKKLDKKEREKKMTEQLLQFGKEGHAICHVAIKTLRCAWYDFVTRMQGCQISLSKTYQNGNYVTNGHKTYQMTTKDKTAIKYIKW